MICLRSLDELIGALPIALVGVDAHGTIVCANEEAEALLRYSRADLLGQPVEILVPPSVREAHAAARATFWQAPADRAMAASRDLNAVAGDGTMLSVRVALKSIRSEDETVVLAGVVDLTGEKRLEEELREQFNQMERHIAERTADLAAKNREMTALLASLEAARTDLERLSRVDPLTGLTNRREFDAVSESEVTRAARNGDPICIAMLDLDHFKAVNDRYGHRVGDAALRRVAELLKSQCRAADVVARYGGEEFVLLLPRTDLVSACAAIERIRQAVESEDWSRLQEGLALTISAGVAMHEADRTIQATIEMADQRLYESKAAGRNRVSPRPLEPPGDSPAPPETGAAHCVALPTIDHDSDVSRRTLIVFYSMTGNTEGLARDIAAALPERSWEFELLRERSPRKGWRGMMRCVRDAIGRRKPPLLAPRFSPLDFDVVMVGTPVWMGRVSGPVRAYLATERFGNARIGVFVTSGGPLTAATRRDIELACPQPVPAVLHFRDRQIHEAARIDGFLRAMGLERRTQSASAARDAGTSLALDTHAEQALARGDT